MTTITQPKLPSENPALFEDNRHLPPDALVHSQHEGVQHADPRLLGGKGAALARLVEAELPVPPFVVVTTSGARACLDEAILQQLAVVQKAEKAAAILAAVS